MLNQIDMGKQGRKLLIYTPIENSVISEYKILSIRDGSLYIYIIHFIRTETSMRGGMHNHS